MANPVGRHLETILNAADSPADENHDPDVRVLVLEMPILGKGHEDVGDRQ